MKIYILSIYLCLFLFSLKSVLKPLNFPPINYRYALKLPDYIRKKTNRSIAKCCPLSGMLAHTKFAWSHFLSQPKSFEKVFFHHRQVTQYMSLQYIQSSVTFGFRKHAFLSSLHSGDSNASQFLKRWTSSWVPAAGWFKAEKVRANQQPTQHH